MVNTGSARFLSDAPLERIEAETKMVKGALKLSDRTFAFSIENQTFNGFNSPLQQEHFFENYIETHKFPASTFVGQIIEQVDLSKPGEYDVRAKGKLNIHGVSKERIIKVRVISDGQKMNAQSVFSVLLDEHGIGIPKIVQQKISSEIQVWVNLEFLPKE